MIFLVVIYFIVTDFVFSKDCSDVFSQNLSVMTDLSKSLNSSAHKFNLCSQLISNYQNEIEENFESLTGYGYSISSLAKSNSKDHYSASKAYKVDFESRIKLSTFDENKKPDHKLIVEGQRLSTENSRLKDLTLMVGAYDQFFVPETATVVLKDCNRKFYDPYQVDLRCKLSQYGQSQDSNGLSINKLAAAIYTKGFVYGINLTEDEASLLGMYRSYLMKREGLMGTISTISSAFDYIILRHPNAYDHLSSYFDDGECRVNTLLASGRIDSLGPLEDPIFDFVSMGGLSLIKGGVNKIGNRLLKAFPHMTLDDIVKKFGKLHLSTPVKAQQVLLQGRILSSESAEQIAKTHIFFRKKSATDGLQEAFSKTELKVGKITPDHPDASMYLDLPEISLTAQLDGKNHKLGYLTYEILDDESIKIGWIKVGEEYRQQGIQDLLLKKLVETHPKKSILTSLDETNHLIVNKSLKEILKQEKKDILKLSKKELESYTRQAILDTPAYKSRKKFGYSKLENVWVNIRKNGEVVVEMKSVKP